MYKLPAYTYVGEDDGVCGCVIPCCANLSDRRDAHRELYPKRVGHRVTIVSWDPAMPYGIVVRWKDGFRGIARPKALSPVPDLPQLRAHRTAAGPKESGRDGQSVEESGAQGGEEVRGA